MTVMVVYNLVHTQCGKSHHYRRHYPVTPAHSEVVPAGNVLLASLPDICSFCLPHRTAHCTCHNPPADLPAVNVDEFYTTCVSSTVHGPQPCELHLTGLGPQTGSPQQVTIPQHALLTHQPTPAFIAGYTLLPLRALHRPFASHLQTSQLHNPTPCSRYPPAQPSLA